MLTGACPRFRLHMTCQGFRLHSMQLRVPNLLAAACALADDAAMQEGHSSTPAHASICGLCRLTSLNKAQHRIVCSCSGAAQHVRQSLGLHKHTRTCTLPWSILQGEESIKQLCCRHRETRGRARRLLTAALLLAGKLPAGAVRLAQAERRCLLQAGCNKVLGRRRPRQ